MERNLPVNKVKGENLNNLTEIDAQNKLQKALEHSNGKAAIIIHPYHTEWRIHRMTKNNPGIRRRLLPQLYWSMTNEDPKEYRHYRNQLKTSAKRYQQLNFPILIFQAEDSNTSLGETLKRLGITQLDNVFIITTESHDPTPLNDTLPNFVGNLKKLGLKGAVVAGSYLYREPLKSTPNTPLSFTPNRKVPPAMKKYNLEGCVGEMINTLQKENVYGTAGLATFPKTSQKETS